MSIRHPDLEALFGKGLDDLGWEQVSDLVASHSEESEILDFKQAFDQSPTADTEFGKDVCAFANARGGALIYGIQEDNACAKALTPIEFSQSKEQQLRSWAHGRVFPSPEIELRRLPSPDDPSRGCLVVIVAVSARQPHAVQKDRDAGLRYVVRSGRDARTLTESEVAERYGRRFASTEARAERVNAVFQARTTLPPDESNCWAVFSLVPEVAGRFEVSGRALKQLEQHAREIDFPRGLFDQNLIDVRAGFRQVQVTTLDYDRNPCGSYFELHADGSAFGARQIGWRQASSRMPIRSPTPTILASQLCVQTARCVRRLAEHAKAAGCSGAALAKASVVGPSGLRLGVFGFDFVSYARSEPIREGFDPPPITIALDDFLSNPQSWMVATRLLLLDLFNACGLPDVNPIHADGALNSSEQSPQNPLLNWQEVRDVPRRQADS